MGNYKFTENVQQKILEVVKKNLERRRKARRGAQKNVKIGLQCSRELAVVRVILNNVLNAVDNSTLIQVITFVRISFKIFVSVCPKFRWPKTLALMLMVGNMCQKSIFDKSKCFHQDKI